MGWEGKLGLHLCQRGGEFLSQPLRDPLLLHGLFEVFWGWHEKGGWVRGLSQIYISTYSESSDLANLGLIEDFWGFEGVKIPAAMIWHGHMA